MEIQLTFNDDELEFDSQGSFNTPLRDAPPLGRAQIFGERNVFYREGQLGLELVGRRFKTGSARELYDEGLATLMVVVRVLAIPRDSYVCNLILPGGVPGMISAEFGFDEDTLQTDDWKRFTGVASRWKTPTSNELYPLFGSSNIDLLSRLRVEFRRQ